MTGLHADCDAGVRFPGLIHPGLIGTAPSHELLKIWNDRERKLVEDGPDALTLGGVLHTRPLGRHSQPCFQQALICRLACTLAVHVEHAWCHLRDPLHTRPLGKQNFVATLHH